MPPIRYIIFMLLLLPAWGCIKLYDPHIDSGAEGKYVVAGRITDIEGWQEVQVSIASPIGSPKYIPVTGCQVKVSDDKGNSFTMEEYNPGSYHVWMEKSALANGTSYKVNVKTPGGETLESGYDKMPNGPALDSVYYAIVDVANPDQSINRVMQFYVDLNAVGNYSQYYKWDVEETWQYRAAHPAEYYYDGKFHTISPPDSSKIVCWLTTEVKSVFTLSTKSLTQNRYDQFPLHNIDGHSARLGILYSMLVRQLALSEDAYNYWEQLRINSNTEGGLYEKQPLAIKGNVKNITNPSKEVLGYFYAASESKRRYFYQDIPEIELNFDNNCDETGLGRGGWREFGPNDYPVYYYYNSHVLRILSQGCVDCRNAGGSLTKPDFWPN